MSSDSSCGIGGQLETCSCGTIIFDLDGTINADGGQRAAGIGTCMRMDGRKKVTGSIVIKRGNITAKGGACASGIGTGPDGSSSGSMNIRIEGGTVTATAGDFGSTGIGSGTNGAHVVNGAITGGTVNSSLGGLKQVIVGPNATVTGSVSNYDNGIVFNANNTAKDNAEMKGNVVIPNDITLTIPTGKTLTIPEGNTLTVEDGGTLKVDGGTITNNGTIICEEGGTIIGYDGDVIYLYNLSAEMISIAKGPYTYTGTEIKPAVTVKKGEKTFTEGTDYTVTYSNNINVGKEAKIIVTPTASGVLRGEPVEVKFTITPYEYKRESLTAGNYGTICLPYTVKPEDRSGAEFYSIAGKTKEDEKVTSIYLEEVEEDADLVAGQPYIFKATGETLSCKCSTGYEATAKTTNGLVGSYEQTDVPTGDNYYVLKENKIYKRGEQEWKIAANRAYINMNEVPEYTPSPAPAKTIKIGVSDDGTTGIGDVTVEQNDGEYYNLQGQRVAAPSRGIYIVNGKKVIVK